MPGVQVGVYPGQGVAGTEVSSTYEGRHLTLNENELIHPFRVSGFVNKGDPVIICNAGILANRGHAVGVAFNTATAVTDDIAIDTEGIWNLTVFAQNDAGDSAIVAGDPLYIHDGSAGAVLNTGLGDCEISKIRNLVTQIPFGYALGTVVAGGSGRIAVKVHWDPRQPTTEFVTVTSGAYNYGKTWTGILNGGQSTGVGGYFCAQVSGVQTGGIYGWGAWTEPGATFVGAGLLVAGEFGIWDGQGADISANWVVLLQLQAILAGAPATLNIFRVNVAAPGGAIDGIFQFANPTSAGFVAGAGVTSTKVGDIPFAQIVGLAGTAWIRLYDAAG